MFQNTKDTCLRVYLLGTETMTKATFIRTTFNWGWFTGSEAQSIIIKVGA
jgi:PhoPQ-activated pathogenicity-related protein